MNVEVAQRACVVGTLAVLAAACAEPSDDTPPAVVAPGSLVAGESLAAWSERWWQWIAAIPASRNPISGGECTEGQSGPVWYLAGSKGDGAVRRSCAIPGGRHVFFPILNVAVWPCHEEEGCETPHTEETMAAYAADGMQDVTVMSASVDGVALRELHAHRLRSGVFSFSAPADPAEQSMWCSGVIGPNACGIAEGPRFAVSDGYWIMLEPLSSGAHTVQFAGEVPYEGEDGTPMTFALDVTYDLTVQ